MKTYIACCICRNENAYIQEFCEHYFALGFSKIVLCDNRKTENDERLLDVEYLQTNSNIDVIENSSECYQLPFYNYVLENYDFDWCLCVDTDEFLILENHNTIDEFVSQKCYDDTDVIMFNWKIIGCDGNIKYEDKPVKERFKTPLIHPRDKHFKSLIKKGKNTVFHKNPHVIQHNGKIFRDANGEKITNFKHSNGAISDNEPVYKNAWLNHYYTKSLEEFICKTRKQKADSSSLREIEDIFNYEHRKDEYVKYLLDNGYDNLSWKSFGIREALSLRALMTNPNNIRRLTPKRVENLKKVLDYCENEMGGMNIRLGELQKWMTSQHISFGDGDQLFIKVLSKPNDFDPRFLTKQNTKPITYKLEIASETDEVVKNEIKSPEERRLEKKNSEQWWEKNVHMSYLDTTGKAKIKIINFFNVALREFDDFVHTNDLSSIFEYVAEKKLLRNPATLESLTFEELIDIFEKTIKSSENIGFTDHFYWYENKIDIYTYRLTDYAYCWALCKGTCGRNEQFKILSWENFEEFIPKDVETIEELLNKM